MDKYQPVMVTWMDALHRSTGWGQWGDEEANETLFQAIHAVIGFFLRKDSNYVYVAQAVNVVNNMVSSVFAVPLGYRTKIIILNPIKGKKDKSNGRRKHGV